MSLPLHPQSKPYASGHLPERDGHAIYFEECGNPHGQPLLYLHGGPGSGFSHAVTRLLDPAAYRIILMDQRGSGRSTPHGSLENNTTPHLIADIEHLRTHLGINTWMLFGGSWGATLAMAYAMANPTHVSRMLIYGTFLARRDELRALYFKGGVAAALFPDVFEPFINALPTDQQDDPIAGYAALFQHHDATIRTDALRRWTLLEKAVSRLITDPQDLETDLQDEDYVLAHSLIENHYFRHAGFIDAADILKHAATTLRGIPTDIVASRYDIVCPLMTAHELAAAIPHARLTIVPDAGHTWRDPANTKTLLTLLDAYAQKDRP